MRTYFKKLFYSSAISLICVGINFDTEARVTKEVAEAVLPYLMKAAGIEEDPRPDSAPATPYYAPEKLKAILSMIYTDEGQQQMVNWVKTGEFPNILKEKFGEQNTYSDKSYRDNSLAALFPCQTNTFTSFANHESRLGKHLLSVDSVQQLRVLKRIFQKNFDIDSILTNLNSVSKNNIDSIIAKIIFVLEICDEAPTIAHFIFPSSETRSFITKMKKTPSNCEYLCRPVSAVVAKNISGKYEGNCVETLHKHLVNIAIQDVKDRNKFHSGKLPKVLQQYYKVHSKSKITELSEGVTYAGETSIVRHDKWKEQLLNLLKEVTLANCRVQHIGKANPVTDEIAPILSFNSDDTSKLEKFLSTGSIQNIATVLASIANSQIEEENPADTIRGALNTLSPTNDKQFEVNCSEEGGSNYPWLTNQITIREKVNGKTTRTIIVGTCQNKSDLNNGHTEIISITPNSDMQ